MESYEELDSGLIQTGKCSVCGACISACPLYYIKLIDGKPNRPKKKAACRDCGVCFNACYLTSQELDVGGGVGSIIRVLSASMKNESKRNACQDGGVVTAILEYALSEGYIDGALVTGQDGWRPKPTIIKSAGDLIQCAKTKYGASPLLAEIRPAIVEHNLERIGLVGLPCHIRSVQNIRRRKIEPLGSSIALTIGLFCTENLEYSSIEKEVIKIGMKMDDVQKFTVNGGFFNIHSADRTEKISLEKTTRWIPGYCPCIDFSCEFSDISVGSVFTPGSSIVIVRTEKGDRIMEGLEKNDLLTVLPVQDISFIIKASNRKMSKSKAGDKVQQKIS